MKTYSAHDLRQRFQQPFDLAAWTDLLQHLFQAQQLRRQPEPLTDHVPDTDRGWYLGQLTTTDQYNIGLYHYQMATSVVRRRVGLRQLVRSLVNPSYGVHDAALVVFSHDQEWRLSLVCDLDDEQTAPRRFTFVFGDPLNGYRTPVDRFLRLQAGEMSFERLHEAFSVEALSKEFYEKLFDWYRWAQADEMDVTFPLNPDTVDDDREGLNVKLIRLITRLLFVWFIKQKGLVPDEIFDPQRLKDILANFDPQATDDGRYYNAILQNLFFATLNCPVVDEDGNPRRFADSVRSHDTRNLYRDNDPEGRYPSMFRISHKEVVRLFERVPFLNGGLFECLDRPRQLYPELAHDQLYDGFSRNGAKAPNGHFKYRAFIPNVLFFSTDERQPGLLTLLQQYNFTIEENAPNDAEISLDPELLGRVFENLLADYNPETQESARKATGSYYTPREIVAYMVDEALTAYLSGQGIDGVDDDALHTLMQAPTEADPALWTAERTDAVCQALRRVQILDPACGSGAFPMGCLLRMVELIEALEALHGQATDRYRLKLDLIERCIYGVDIQPIAMLICKLRFFISLVCEQGDIDFSSPQTNYGVNTLPNLETKFVAANSLLSADIRHYNVELGDDDHLLQLQQQLLDIRRAHLEAKGIKAKRSWRKQDKQKREEINDYVINSAQTPNTEAIALLERRLAQLQDELEHPADVGETMSGFPHRQGELWPQQVAEPVQGELFGAPSPSTAPTRQERIDQARRRTRADIERTKAQLKRERDRGEIRGFAAAVQQLTDWDPYDQNLISPFFDAEWMFGVKQGFDIVIGNPPYIQLQNNHGELADLYQGCGFQTFARSGDIYCLFYERGHQLLRPAGHLCYITSNKWMRAGYGEATRRFFAEHTDPLRLIDFAGVKVFESATVDVNILLFARANNRQQTICSVASKQNAKTIKHNLAAFVRSEHSVHAFQGADAWVILSPIEESIKRKIEAVGTPLRDWDIQINYGIKTGYNPAFIISTQRRDQILANCQTEDERKRTAELIRPILRGKDIKRYGYQWAGKWLIATFPSRHYDINDYPAVEHWLLTFAQELLLENGFDWIANDPAKLRDYCYQRLTQTGKHIIIDGKRLQFEKNDKARKKTNNKWFETQDSISYWDLFFQPKICWKAVGRSLSFAIVEPGIFLSAPASFISAGSFNAYIEAYLHSNVGKYFIYKYSDKTGAGDIMLNIQSLIQFPIPHINDTTMIEELVKKQIESYSNERQRALDKAIYASYGFSKEEIEVIEKA